MIFSTENIEKAKKYLDELKESGVKKVEVKKYTSTRTGRQNQALHLLFEQVAKELNNLGIPFVYRGLKGMEIETTWTKELFKEMTWKPIQKAMFGTDSTTKLKTDEIDKIFEVINKFFAEKGIEVTFPNEFDYYLKFYDKN
jgi:hypothetical protein